MKKSFDYFKTLKDLSRINGVIFSSVASGGDFKKQTLTFYGQRFELLQRLSDDFVAPIERNDIYNLTHNLYNQFCKIIILGDMADGSLDLPEAFLSEFQELFIVQSDLMTGFGKKSDYTSLLKICRQAQQQALTLKRKVASFMVTGLQNSKQPLFRCVVLNAVSDFCNSISDTFCICEKVFINNI